MNSRKLFNRETVVLTKLFHILSLCVAFLALLITPETIQASGTADLSVVESSPATALIGDSVIYTITYTNNGPDAVSATFRGGLPPTAQIGHPTPAITFGGFSHISGPSAGCTLNTTFNYFTCASVTLAPGDVSVYQIRANTHVSTPDESFWKGCGGVSVDDTTDPDTANNNSCSTTVWS